MPHQLPARASFLSRLLNGKVARTDIKFCFVYCSLALFVGLTFDPTGRSTIVESDFFIYQKAYAYARSESLNEFISSTRWDHIYTVITWLTANLGLSFVDFTRLAALTLVLTYSSMAITATKDVTHAALASALFVASPIFISLTEVVIRHGFSLNFIFLAVISGIKNRFILMLVLLLAAALTHSSNFIVGAVILIAFLFPERWKFVSKIAVGFLALYVFNLPAELVGSVASRVASFLFQGYSAGFAHYQIGFKFSFFLASAITLFPSVYFIGTRKVAPSPLRPLLLLTGLLTVFYICAANLPYHDRIATISWLFAPVLLVSTFRFRIMKTGFENTRLSDRYMKGTG